ncbi:hypothetical protein AAX05_04010 [Moraxella bovoculi]|uniref:DUF2798 domain-containing protein n=2 Tax=Moraxella bovoculi TaxID=386891 RepID=A0AAC8PVX2_9GAMM|nr:hypothetical protein AAX06_07295 [Moraxella bovoculi]AKG09471.1 hypothetical protein AAX05_04010 [Moraxella bovoculi]AKG11287.1 hypothetical protein AAX07_03985 [Moraxella bovoculi]AKG13294.1 hypothetical protein AAX11_03755 [Moraxella bovoculi]
MASNKFSSVIFALYMAAIMAFIMSLVSVAMNTGIDDNYLIRVFWAYIKTMPITFVCILSLRPLVVRLTERTLGRWSS